jgi:hypothetical protein
MRILIDFNGTLLNNPSRATLQQCLQAGHDLGEAGHDVSIVSGDPEGASEALVGYPVLDKCDAMREFGGRLHGVMIVDDDPMILAAAVRQGAVAVPAAMLCEMARAMRGFPPGFTRAQWEAVERFAETGQREPSRPDPVAR